VQKELVLKPPPISSGLRVIVIDGTAEPPETRQRRDDLEAGLGLLLVEALADSSGAQNSLGQRGSGFS
jgi:hypothetical protein